jgi:uncharacterized membrane protein
MRTFGKITIPYQGLRFVPSELLENAGYTILCLAVWALFACVAAIAIKEVKLVSRYSMTGCVIAVLSPMWIANISFLQYPWGRSFFIAAMTQTVFPKGIFFLVLFFTIHSLWRLARVPRAGLDLQEAGLECLDHPAPQIRGFQRQGCCGQSFAALTAKVLDFYSRVFSKNAFSAACSA